MARPTDGTSTSALRSAIPWLLPAIAAMLLAWWVSVVAGWAPLGYSNFVDWTTYATGTERALAGSSLYLPEQLAGPYHLPDVTPEGYIYPPPSAVMFLPFTLGGNVGLSLWVAVNIAVFISGLAAVLRRELGGIRPLPATAVLLGLVVPVIIPGVVVATPFATGVVVANVNVALAGLLAWCWAVPSRGWIAYAAGAGAAFKVFPGALALWAVRRHGPRPLLIAVGVAAAISLATLPIVGPDEWVRFLGALGNALPTCDGGRTSVACLAQDHIGSSLAKALGVTIGVVLMVASLRVRREFPAFVVLSLGMLAPLADGHQHYLLFVYVLIVVGACRLWAARGAAGAVGRGSAETTKGPRRVPSSSRTSPGR